MPYRVLPDATNKRSPKKNSTDEGSARTGNSNSIVTLNSRDKLLLLLCHTKKFDAYDQISTFLNHCCRING